MSASMSWQDRWGAVMMSNYGTPAVMLTRGAGSRVWDTEGNEYIDLIAGIAVNALGHADPRMESALSDQFTTLGHVSNLYASEPGLALAERLVSLVADDTAGFLLQSGAEGNAAFKMTRLTGRSPWSWQRVFHGRDGVVGADGPTEQGRSIPAPSRDVVVVPYGDADALAGAVDAVLPRCSSNPSREGGVIGSARLPRARTSAHRRCRCAARR